MNQSWTHVDAVLLLAGHNNGPLDDILDDDWRNDILQNVRDKFLFEFKSFETDWLKILFVYKFSRRLVDVTSSEGSNCCVLVSGHMVTGDQCYPMWPPSPPPPILNSIIYCKNPTTTQNQQSSWLTQASVYVNPILIKLWFPLLSHLKSGYKMLLSNEEIHFQGNAFHFQPKKLNTWVIKSPIPCLFTFSVLFFCLLRSLIWWIKIVLYFEYFPSRFECSCWHKGDLLTQGVKFQQLFGLKFLFFIEQ